MCVCVCFLLAVCGNNKFDAGEQCDDGNLFSNDGCSSLCQYENPDYWLCRNSTGNVAPTVCCKGLTNPVTKQRVCSCAGQASDSALYTILPSTCEKLDVDECSLGQSNCHPNAICNNTNGVLPNASKGFECVCPPGLIGDGVTSCELYAYQTSFAVAAPPEPIETFNPDTFKDFLLTSGVVPGPCLLCAFFVPGESAFLTFLTRAGDISKDRIDVEVIPADSRRSLEIVSRKLLQSDSGSYTVVVTVSSTTAADQNLITSGVNTTVLESFGFQTVTPPFNAMATIESADDPIDTMVGGFQVKSVEYNDADSR